MIFYSEFQTSRIRMSERAPLESLAPVGVAGGSYGGKGNASGKAFAGGALLTFILLFIIKPKWLMKLDVDGHVSDQIDWWTMLLSCLVGGFIIMLGSSMR